ncbi:hypothetical protein J2X90_005630 [Variovorax paradoxus]|uniref:DUF2262 domain-containing protein n=1 Tax=Variovorax paradoxus TaxID=34073 RepID=UPI002789FDEC|nr:DUF2262 domain-containing protein [Variovorax paradoxus]MDQ0027794.1 hypothetical protein [Variovorax paradoxus]
MPADFVHPVLGALAYDQGLNWYSADGASNSVPQLYLSLDECPDEDVFIAQASRRLESLSASIARAKGAACSLLELANSEWLPEGATPMDAAGFMAKLTVDSATFYPDGTMDVIFRADDLFAGHGVIVSLDADGQAIDAAICG